MSTENATILSEQSAQVLHRLLGVTREQYEALAAKGITGEGPPPGWQPGPPTRS